MDIVAAVLIVIGALTQLVALIMTVFCKDDVDIHETAEVGDVAVGNNTSVKIGKNSKVGNISIGEE
jgi:hypothetical protein